MKVIIEGRAFFPEGPGYEDDAREVPIEVRGHPDDDLERGMVLIVHEKVSLELSYSDLRAALRAFAPSNGWQD